MRLALGLLALTAANATAQPGADTPANEPAANPSEAPEPEGRDLVDEGTVADPVAGRAWFFPTALTPPAGSLSISWTELVVLSGSWSPVNTIQISANSFLPVLFDDGLFAGTLSGKLQLVRAPRLRVTAYGLALFANEADGDSDVFGGLLGGVASYCLDDECHSLLSLFGAAALARGNDNDVPLVLTASWIQRLHRNIKLAFEVVGVYVGGEIDGVAAGAITTGGVRFVSRSVALELGLAGLLAEGEEDVPLPWVSLTFRGGL